MGVVHNYITGENATFMSSVLLGGLTEGEWTATTGSIAGSMAYSKSENFDSLLVGRSAKAFEFSLDGIATSSEFDKYSFHAWVFVNAPSAVNGETSISIDVDIAVDDPIAHTLLSAVRTNGQVAATFAETGGLLANQYITVSGCDASFNGSRRIARVSGNTVYWPDSNVNATSSALGSIEVVAPTKTTVAFITTNPQNWTLIRSNELVVPADGSPKNLTITISGTGAEFDFYFSRPTVIATEAWLKNRFVMQMSNFVPEYLIDADATAVEPGEMPTYPMLRYLDVCHNQHNTVLDQFQQFSYADIENEKDTADTETLSTLIDPAAAPAGYFPWLLSVTGNDLANPGLTSTPWGSLPSTWLGVMTDVDPASTTVSPSDLTRATNVVTATVGSSTGFTTGDYVVVSGATPSSFNGTFLITGTTATTIVWSQSGTDESTSVDGTITLVDTEWGEILEYAPDILGLIQYLRWIVTYSAFGNWAGTQRGLEDAIQQNLINDQVFDLIRNPSGSNPWELKIESATADTQGGIVSTENTALLDAVELARPAGFILSHECV
jgi:hypothetical protein